jgi:hypothetical protein
MTAAGFGLFAAWNLLMIVMVTLVIAAFRGPAAARVSAA